MLKMEQQQLYRTFRVASVNIHTNFMISLRCIAKIQQMLDLLVYFANLACTDRHSYSCDRFIKTHDDIYSCVQFDPC